MRDYISDYGFIGLDDQPVKFLKKTEIAELRVLESKRKEELRKLRSLERLKAVENKSSGELAVAPKNGKSPRKSDPSQVNAGERSIKAKSKLRESSHSVDTSVGTHSESIHQMETVDFDKISDR